MRRLAAGRGIDVEAVDRRVVGRHRLRAWCGAQRIDDGRAQVGRARIVGGARHAQPDDAGGIRADDRPALGLASAVGTGSGVADGPLHAASTRAPRSARWRRTLLMRPWWTGRAASASRRVPECHVEATAQTGPPQRPVIQMLPRTTNAVTTSATRVRALPGRMSCPSKASSENAAPDAANRTRRRPSLGHEDDAACHGQRDRDEQAPPGPRRRPEDRSSGARGGLEAMNELDVTTIAGIRRRRRRRAGPGRPRGASRCRARRTIETAALLEVLDRVEDPGARMTTTR